VNHRLVQASGVIFDTNGLFSLVELDAADAIDLANAGDGERSGLGGGCAIPVENVELSHESMIAVRRLRARSVNRLELVIL
jgi:hypothetical protein